MQRRASLTPRQGQAMVELAVFGTLLLVCLSMLVRFGLQMMYRLEAEQSAFRKALQVATLDNSDNFRNDEAIYTIVQDRRIPDPLSPFRLTSLTPVQGSGHVVWGWDLFFRDAKKEGVPNPIEVNYSDRTGRGFKREFNVNDFSQSDEHPGGLLVDSLRTTTQEAAMDRDEDAAGITTRVRNDVREDVRRVIRTKSRDFTITQGFEEQPDVTWTTPHAQ